MNRVSCSGGPSAHVHGSHLRSTHNPLYAALPSVMAAVMDSLVTDLFQVALRCVQSQEQPGPLSLYPGGLPRSQPDDEATAVAEGRGDVGMRAN